MLINPRSFRLFVALMAAVLAAVVYADSRLPRSTPESVGFDPARLARIAPHFQSRVDAGEIAGIVTLVARRGQVVHLEAVGYQDAVRRIPMEVDTIFRIYSMTKPIASTALMMLYEEGRLQLADPIAKYIPEFERLKVLRTPDGPIEDTVPLERPPTIRDVLRHTAGFSHGLGTSEYDRQFVGTGIFRPDTSLEKMMTLLSGIPLMDQPGARFRYSIGPDIALRLVEVVSGQSADDYLQQRIFSPLDMVDTGYWVAAADTERLAPVHWLRNGDLVPIDDEYGAPDGGVLNRTWSVNSYTADHAFKGGSFGLLSTAADYWRYAQAMLNGGALGGIRILGPRTVAFMTRNHLTDEQGAAREPGTGFGLGFGVIEDAAQSQRRFSDRTFYWSGYAATMFWIDPAEGLVVVGMTQHIAVPATASIGEELAVLVYSALID